jgi:hypothetical protein
MAVSGDRKRWLLIAVLLLIVISGAVLRFHDLTTASIGHAEIFVPGIALPPDLSIPRPRFSLLETVSGTIGAEPHPPGYYVLMFGWTKLFGTKPLSLRLPSAMLGIASLFLIYALGILEQDRLTALVATGMLAFNGYHIFMSQRAKLYMLACFLGLLATVLLVWLSRQRRPYTGYVILYVITVLFGMGTVVFFWLLLLVHILWTFGISVAHRYRRLGLLRWQILTSVLGTPLWAIAAYQSKRPSYVELNGLELGQFLQFGSLLQPALLNPDQFAAPPHSVFGVAAIVGLMVLALVLLGLGVKAGRLSVAEATQMQEPPGWLMLCAAFVAIVAINLFAVLAHAKAPGRTLYILSTNTVPVALTVMGLLTDHQWCNLRDSIVLRSAKLRLWKCFYSVSVTLTLVPVAALLAISVVVPIFAAQTALMFTPYLLVTLGSGVAWVIRYNRWWFVLILVLAAMHSLSVVHYKQRLHHPVDHKSLAQKWIPHIRETDLIFTQKHYVATPIFYYVSADRYRFVGRDYGAEISKNPGSRIWVLSFEGLDSTKEMKDALAGWKPLLSVEALRAKAVLYGKSQ